MTKWYIGMSEDAIRQRVVETAVELMGIREGTVDHKRKIVDVYNSLDKLPRGYQLQEDDAWCAAFITVIGILLGISHIILPECGCALMIELYKDQGWWEEWDGYIPRPGDLVMYDWQAERGECIGAPDHVGMVVSVEGKTITIIEGNYENQVKLREICVEYIKVRGYCLPNYSALETWFKDVPLDAWYKDEVYRAKELGIVEGVGGCLFEPERPATRAEVSAMMVRLYDLLK